MIIGEKMEKLAGVKLVRKVPRIVRNRRAKKQLFEYLRDLKNNQIVALSYKQLGYKSPINLYVSLRHQIRNRYLTGEAVRRKGKVYYIAK